MGRWRGRGDLLPASRMMGFTKEEMVGWLGVQPVGTGDGLGVGMRGLCKAGMTA